MPRPIVRAAGGQSRLTVRGTRESARANTLPVLTAARSGAYLDAFRRLDARGPVTPADFAAEADRIRREFDDKWAATPLGLVAHCYLGRPYEAHVVDVAGGIVQHYTTGQSLPLGLERARPLANTEDYLVIEVYPNQLVCIRPDGATVTLKG
jgi:hypothetical protein